MTRTRPLQTAAERHESSADEMRALVATLSGHELHRAVDELMCRLMREAGHGEAVDVFLQAVEGYHQ